MHEETKVRYATGDFKQRVCMRAYRTATPGIVIHRAVDQDDPHPWAVTVESCGARLGRADSEDGARAIAGAYGGLPIKWEKIPEITSMVQHNQVVDVLRKRLEAAPEVFNWLHLMNTSGAA